MSNTKNIAATYFSTNNERFVFIDGNTCDSVEKCYATLQQQLSIPDYFGHNLDALEEVLADIEWVQEEIVQIILLNEKEFVINSVFRVQKNFKIQVYPQPKKICLHNSFFRPIRFFTFTLILIICRNTFIC